MRRKILCLLILIVVLCCVFAACDKDKPNDDSSNPPQDEYTLDCPDGYRQLVLYWDGDFDNKCDVWAWYDGSEGRGYVMKECNYGGKCIINVPQEIVQVGFIVRTNCSNPAATEWGTAEKDYPTDRYVQLTSQTTTIYLKTGDGGQYKSNDGGKTLNMLKNVSKMTIKDFYTISYALSQPMTIDSLSQVDVKCDGQSVQVSELSTLGSNSRVGEIVLLESIDLSKTYVVTIADFPSKEAFPLEIFDCEQFVSEYVYDGNDLGAVVDNGGTTFKLWAPTASNVVLNLFQQGNDCDAFDTVSMTKGEKGVWSHYASNIGHGTYYTYTVTTTNGTQEAVDPYARSAGVNGQRGMVIDLAQTNPDGFASSNYMSAINSYEDAIIWEVHVRDFSNKITQSQYKGKYLAFTETGLANSSGVPVGVDYLQNLGVTHVHLLPVYDYETVDEGRLDVAQFNWGYDPQNYNVPEGSYSTNPFDGAVRVTEFKQMVQALHQKGLGVVMDVVYNHTSDNNSNLNKVVPYYYYRFNADGTYGNGSGCGNETASNRQMFRKYMVDSVTYWLTEYKLDGFRFDLMALHDVETMQQIEQAVHAINPHAIIYGEGWTGGDSLLSSGLQANQQNIRKITTTSGAVGGIAVFNDKIRDGLKGSVFLEKGKGYINGNTIYENMQGVKFGIVGGSGGSTFWVNNNAVINYMSAHDNNTLWDKLAMANATNSVEERVAMNKMGAAIVLMSRGTPFMQAGEEFLRSKPNPQSPSGFDENSYKSNDDVNNIVWDSLTAGSHQLATSQYYAGLIALRKSVAAFTASDTAYNVTTVNKSCLKAVLSNQTEDFVVMLTNPTDQAVTFDLPSGNWSLVVNGETAGTSTIANCAENVTVEPHTVFVLIKQ